VNTLEVRRRGPIGEIRLRRPQVLNAMGLGFPEDLLAAAGELGGDPGVRVVLVTGEGRAFSSGLDLDDLAAGHISVEWFHRAELAFRALETLDKLVIAGVQGWCLGGGMQLAIACDVRVAADDAFFGLPAAREAFLPGMGGVWRLPRLIGMGRARHLVLSGETVGAAEAERIGMVNTVVPRDALFVELEAWAKRYMELPGPSLRWAKRLCDQAFDLPFEAFLDRMDEAMAAVLATEEHLAARRAWAARKEAGEAPEFPRPAARP
jgi:enoyl-CoA hydratase/carnithine racemase